MGAVRWPWLKRSWSGWHRYHPPDRPESPPQAVVAVVTETRRAVPSLSLDGRSRVMMTRCSGGRETARAPASQTAAGVSGLAGRPPHIAERHAEVRPESAVAGATAGFCGACASD